MKTMTVDEFVEDPESFLDSSRTDRLLILRAGKPVAWVVGAEEYDDEDLLYITSPKFWELIQQRRNEPANSLEGVKSTLFNDAEE